MHCFRSTAGVVLLATVNRFSLLSGVLYDCTP